MKNIIKWQSKKKAKKQRLIDTPYGDFTEEQLKPIDKRKSSIIL